mmetsp:Transcript_4136/g.15565  ORF Transcript_4136/g.15565 Transcript_4136/m.15565 type:complete len:440 (-) Transcript_4136:2282-3601(-)
MTKNKPRRKPCKLGTEDFKTVMQLGLTQKEGAQYLDICLSSFKRQFSKTQLKWPSLGELRSHKHHREMRKKLGRMIDFLDVELAEVRKSDDVEYDKSNTRNFADGDTNTLGGNHVSTIASTTTPSLDDSSTLTAFLSDTGAASTLFSGGNINAALHNSLFAKHNNSLFDRASGENPCSFSSNSTSQNSFFSQLLFEQQQQLQQQKGNNFATLSLNSSTATDGSVNLPANSGIPVDRLFQSAFLNNANRLKEQILSSSTPLPTQPCTAVKVPFLGDISLLNGPWRMNIDHYQKNNIGVVVFDENLNVMACNALYHSITGYTSNEMAPSFSHVDTVMLRVYPSSFYIQIYRRLLATLNFMCMQNTWLNKDQNEVFLKITFKKFHPSPGLPSIGYFEVEPLSQALPSLTIGETVINKSSPISLVEDHIQSFQILDSNVPQTE